MGNIYSIAKAWFGLVWFIEGQKAGYENLFRVHSPDPLQCGDQWFPLDASSRLRTPLKWEMKDIQIQKAA